MDNDEYCGSDEKIAHEGVRALVAVAQEDDRPPVAKFGFLAAMNCMVARHAQLLQVVDRMQMNDDEPNLELERVPTQGSVLFLVVGHEGDDNTIDDAVVGDGVDAKAEEADGGMGGCVTLEADNGVAGAAVDAGVH